VADDDPALIALNNFKQAQSAKPVDERRVEVEEDNTKKLIDAMDALGEIEVLVGIPAGSTRNEGTIDNAALGYIHEFGSPINNIPARPFLRPGVKNSADRWQPRLAAAAEEALKGDSSAMMGKLDEAGMIASGAVKKTILAGIPPPVSRRRRGTRAAMGPGDAIPLVDTGQLLRSITWVVKK
jgi:hypothetical protein